MNRSENLSMVLPEKEQRAWWDAIIYPDFAPATGIFAVKLVLQNGVLRGAMTVPNSGLIPRGGGHIVVPLDPEAQVENPFQLMAHLNQLALDGMSLDKELGLSAGPRQIGDFVVGYPKKETDRLSLLISRNFEDTKITEGRDIQRRLLQMDMPTTKDLLNRVGEFMAGWEREISKIITRPSPVNLRDW